VWWYWDLNSGLCQAGSAVVGISTQVLRVLEPALRMKAQVDSDSRGQKDFICREEKRKTAYWRMQEDPETSDPGGGKGLVGSGVYSLFALPDGEDAFQMQRGIS
jgi:hypothetical protein